MRTAERQPKPRTWEELCKCSYPANICLHARACMWALTFHSKPQTQHMSGICQIASFCQVGFYINSCSFLIDESSWFSQHSNLLGSCQSKSIQWWSHRSEESCTPLLRNQSPVIQVKNQCWGRKASAEQLRQIWAGMKPSAINSSAKAQCSCLAYCHHSALDLVYWTLHADFVYIHHWGAVNSCLLCRLLREAGKNFFSRKIGSEIQRKPSGKNQEWGA